MEAKSSGETTEQFARKMRAIRAGRSYGAQKNFEFHQAYGVGKGKLRRHETRTRVREAMAKHSIKPGGAR